jgi:hypothetical protein
MTAALIAAAMIYGAVVYALLRGAKAADDEAQRQMEDRK